MSDLALKAARAEQVWDLLADRVRPGSTLDVPLEQAAGAVLARDVRAGFDYPPFDRAVMDGYALRAEDLTEAQASLPCTGLVRAGDEAIPALEPGACVQINTGAPLPAGADAIVMVEQTAPGDGGCVLFRAAAEEGQNIERRGATLRTGDLVLRAGTRIGAGEIAALAAAGAGPIRVFQWPRVGILSTGDEVVRGAGAPRAGQIFDSNAVMLAELVKAAGGIAVPLGGVGDDAEALRGVLARGLECDVLCVTGGMSMGTHDLVPAELERLGVRWLVSSLDLKPGKPTRIGRSPREGWVVGLPGNPVSCAVCFLLFARAIIEGLQGLPLAAPTVLYGRLGAEMPGNGARPMYQPAQWTATRDGLLVTPIAWRGSGDPFGLVGANALIERPAKSPPAPYGDVVPFVPLGGPQ